MRAKTNIIAIFFFIMLLAPVRAFEIANPPLAEQLNIDFEQYGTVSVSGGNLQYISLNISTFQNNENQKVVFPESQAFAKDEFGNELLQLTQKRGNLQLNYNAKGSAEIAGKHTYSIPLNYRLSENEKKFLMPTKSIQSDNPKIASLARNITRNAKGDFEKAALLAIWVHSNVNYTLDLGDMAKDAIWVLNNRIGTCDEFSTLFIAMARSVGIPAKYVSGWVYGNDGWQKHAWAEVYMGVWVPVDATWLEVGNLDATHIKFMETADNYVANQAKAYGTNLGAIEWVVPDSADISATNIRERAPVRFEETSPSAKIGVGKSAIVWMKVMPKEYLVDELDLAPCKGINIIRVENKNQPVIFEAGKEKIIAWKISSSENLGKGSVYTCPLTLNSRFFEKKEIEITVDPRITDSLGFSASLDKSAAQPNENITIEIEWKLQSRGGIAKFGVVSDELLIEKEANPDTSGGGTLKFTFPAGTAGKHAVYAYSDLGDAAEIEYSVYETGDVFIENVAAPDSVERGKNAAITVLLRNNKHSLQNAKFAVKINGIMALDEAITMPAQSIRIANITIPTEEIGTQRFSMRLVSDSVEEKIKEIRVYDVPELDIEGGYGTKAGDSILTITPRNDGAKNLEISVGGKMSRMSEIKMNESASINLGLAEGVYAVKITYADYGENAHEISRDIEFRKKGIFGMIKETISGLYLWLAGVFRHVF